MHGEATWTEGYALNSVIDLADSATSSLFLKAENLSSVTMPRGMKEEASTKEQCFEVIDTALLRSSDSTSRSRSLGEDESMSELVGSIASLGIIEPIVVRQAEAGAFIVVAGERRLTAAKLLNLRRVPCVVMQCSDGEAQIISLTENLQRSDLNPIEKASALRRLLDEFALTQQEIGKRVGMSQSTIAHHLRLLSLPLEVQRLISEGALSVGHGKVLAAIGDEHEAIDAALECISKNKSVHEFEAWMSSARGMTDKRASGKSSRKKREERELRNGLFLVIKESPDQAGSGTIEIPYCSLDEKNWVLKVLSDQGTKQSTSKKARKL
jgi:ParB family chromosome partitioning protein